MDYLEPLKVTSDTISIRVNDETFIELIEDEDMDDVFSVKINWKLAKQCIDYPMDRIINTAPGNLSVNKRFEDTFFIKSLALVLYTARSDGFDAHRDISLAEENWEHYTKNQKCLPLYTTSLLIDEDENEDNDFCFFGEDYTWLENKEKLIMSTTVCWEAVHYFLDTGQGFDSKTPVKDNINNSVVAAAFLAARATGLEEGKQ